MSYVHRGIAFLSGIAVYMVAGVGGDLLRIEGPIVAPEVPTRILLAAVSGIAAAATIVLKSKRITARASYA